MAKRTLFIVVIAASISLNIYFAIRAWQRHHSPLRAKAANSGGVQAQAIADVFRSMPNDSSDIIFAGTSITAFCPIAEYFPRGKNRGIGGNTSKQLLARADEIYRSKPEKVFIEIGINDITKNLSIDSLAFNVSSIIALLHEKSPATKIYITSINVNRAEFVEKAMSANSRLKVVCNENTNKNCEYIDVTTAMSENGRLFDNLTYDGVHLNAEGYKIWTSILRPYVTR